MERKKKLRWGGGGVGRGGGHLAVAGRTWPSELQPLIIKKLSKNPPGKAS